MNDTPIHVRPATRDDLDTVVAFNQAMAVETEGKSIDSATLTAGVRTALADENRCRYFMAEVDGRVVGQAMFTTEWSDWRNGYFWWFQSVYVQEAFRRRGVFRALYTHVHECAKNQPDVCGLRLYVVRENTRAIETYRSLGMDLTDYLVCEEAWETKPG